MLRSLSIKIKLVVFSVATLLALALALGAWFFSSTRDQMLEGLELRARTIVRNLTHTARYGLLADDEVELGSLVAGVMEDLDVLYVEIHDADLPGRPVARDHKPEARGLLPGLQARSAPAGAPGVVLERLPSPTPGGTGYFELWAPVLGQEGLGPGPEGETSRLGVVRVVVSTARTDSRILDTLRQSLLIALAVVATMIVVSYFVVRATIQPLQDITARTVDIARGRFEERVKVDRADEIGTLGTAFNQMAAAIERSRLELLEAKEYTDNILKSMIDVLLVIDSGGVVIRANRAAGALLGRPPEEIVGRQVGDLFASPDGGDEQLEVGALHERIEAGTLGEMDLALLHRSGEAIPVSVSGAMLSHAEGEPVDYVCVAKDLRETRLLTDLAAANKELQTAQEQLVQAGKMAALGQMLSGIAHELNNPLTGIMGFSELLLTAPSPDRLETGLQRIHKEAGRAKRVVKDLLTFARDHKADGEQRIRVKKIVLEALEILHRDLELEEIEVVRDFDPDLPSTVGDPNQLTQVFVNLVQNALHALKDHQPEVKRVTLSTRVEGGRIVVRVADTGPGVSPDDVEKIFEPFYTTKDVGEGTGLGLSITYSILKAHGGELRYEAGEGGAVFRVDLPVLDSGALPTAPAVDVAGALDTGFADRDILVVDDEESVRDVVEQLFARGDNRIRMAANGREALEAIEAGPFDLVLCDLRMPVMGGAELYLELKERGADVSGRFVFISGNVLDPAARSFLEEHALPHLYKPFTLAELAELARGLAGEGTAG